MGPAPVFHGKAIVVDFHPAVRNARIVHASIHGLVRRLEDSHAKEGELLVAIEERVAQFVGLTAHVVGRTGVTISFAVTRQ